MEFLRRTLADARVRLRVSGLLAAGGPLEEVLALAGGHPAAVLAALRDGLADAPPLIAQQRLHFLERLVDSGGYVFHRAMAHDSELHAQLVRLAVVRAETDEQRRTRRLARLTVLEYSRMFADDPELHVLATLVKTVENCMGRSLLRSLEVENKKVNFIDPRPEDVVLISPIRRPTKDSPTQVSPSTWSCHICTYMNRPTSAKCFACKTSKPTRSSSPPVPASPPGEKINGLSATGENTDTGVVCQRTVAGESCTELIAHTDSSQVKESESALAFEEAIVGEGVVGIKTDVLGVENFDDTE